MPKGKLKIVVTDAAKFEVAANFNDVSIGENQVVGDRMTVEVSYKAPSQLFEMGRTIEQIEEVKKPAQPKKED